MAKPIVYGTPLSTYVRTTRMTLLEKGVDYDHVDVGVLDGECKGPEHVARNPFGKVPAAANAMAGDGKPMFLEPRLDVSVLWGGFDAPDRVAARAIHT